MHADVRDLSAQCDTDAELQDHRKRIQGLSEETAVSLKKNVYKNYMQFIETSKEISCILIDLSVWFACYNCLRSFPRNRSRNGFYLKLC